MKTAKTTLLAGFTVVVAAVTVPAMSMAAPGGRDDGKPVVGLVRSDPLLPQLGNGGYDVEHYRIKLDYDPTTTSSRRRGPRSAPPRPEAQRVQPRLPGDLEVSRDLVDGRKADFPGRGATPS